MKTLKRKTQKIQRRVKKYAPGGMYADNTVSGAGQVNSTANIVYNESNPAILQQKMANFDNVKNTEIANSKQVAQDIATKDAQSKQEILNAKAQSDASFQQGESLVQTGADVYSKFSEMAKAKELKLAEAAKLTKSAVPAVPAVATAETAKIAAAKSIAGEGVGNAARSASASEVSGILAKHTADFTAGSTVLPSNMASGAGSIPTYTSGLNATIPVHPSLASGTAATSTGLSTASTGLGVNAAGTTGANAATTGIANAGTIAPLPVLGATPLPVGSLPGPITSVTPGIVAPGVVNGGSQAASKLAGFGGAGVQGAGTLAKFASSGAGIGMIAGLAGMGISKLSDDGDATKSNFGEYSGSILSAAGTGASVGSLFGPVGTLVGGVGGAIYGGVKQFVGTKKAKRAKEKYERERALEVGKYNKELTSNVINARAAVNAGEVEQKTYSGYDLGRNVVAKYGGKRMYNLGGMQMGMPRYGYAA